MAAEFAPIYTTGRAHGLTRSELRSMPVPLVAVTLVGDSTSTAPGPGRTRRPRRRRGGVVRETGKVFRGKDAR